MSSLSHDYTASPYTPPAVLVTPSAQDCRSPLVAFVLDLPRKTAAQARRWACYNPAQVYSGPVSSYNPSTLTALGLIPLHVESTGTHIHHNGQYLPMMRIRCSEAR